MKPWLLLLLVAVALCGLMAWCSTRTGIPTASKKELRALESHQRAAAAQAGRDSTRAVQASQQAARAYAQGRAWEDSARLYQTRAHENAPIVLDSAGADRLRSFWESYFKK